MNNPYNRFIFILLSALFFSCQNKDSISISGTIENPGNIKVVAFYEGDIKLDSVFLGDGNRFKFERLSSQGRLLSLEVGKNKYPIILEPGAEVNFTTDLQNPEQYSIEGSQLSSDLKEFAPYTSRKKFVEDSLQSEFAKKSNNKTSDQIDELRVEFLGKFRSELNQYTQQAVDFASKHPNLAGFYAMSTLDPELAENEIIAYSDQIKDEFPDNRYVIQFKEEAAKLKVLAIGQPAPEFESFTPDNKVVKLSDFKGKYTLIDFWASWCVPCRQENPNIVRLYNQYKDKGFTVFGVSLDNNPGSWMRAIKDDQLDWTQVSDLQAWSSDLVIKYRLKAIPASYIVDKDGIIIGKNLRGKELENFLSEHIL
ncbi:TlpA family protein disulfide reductase [Sphingobacterium hungaricum]|uniref:Thiol:disulfide interchange protein n=1 Tax=Sphingobacterium hungaricum TaxID=2082723 RepID=A0A928YST8_9SPHI|nr:TlpA disulfide reductase family protein [Sphingobacterium hungaricum]MBE8714583.1 thiol:disulfide interchange protein [Sphingobacterium hungaricum]